MLFIVYYELNPSLDPAEILTAYQKVQEAETEFEKWETKAWYTTPEHWGVAVVETDSVDDIMKSAYEWRLALPGMFKTYNMGIGMVLAVSKNKAGVIRRYISSCGIKAFIIGKVIKGKGVIIKEG